MPDELRMTLANRMVFHLQRIWASWMDSPLRRW